RIDGDAIVLRGAAGLRVDVRSVNAERRDDLADSKRQTIEGEVTVPTVAAGDVAQEIPELVDLARQRDEHDHLLGRVRQVLEVLSAQTEEAKIDRVEELLVVAGDEDAVQIVQIVVTGRAMDGP